MDLAGAVAAQDHRFLAHRGDEEVAGVRDLALVADKEPGAGKDAFQLFLVDLVVDKDLAADLPRRQIDEPRAIAVIPCRHDVLPIPEFVITGEGRCPFPPCGPGLRRGRQVRAP